MEKPRNVGKCNGQRLCIGSRYLCREKQSTSATSFVSQRSIQTKQDTSYAPLPGRGSSVLLYDISCSTEAFMKFTMKTGIFASVMLLAVVSAACVPSAGAAVVAPAASRPFMAMQDDATAPDISGNWQISWTGRKGNQQQATMQIKQDGNNFHGTFSGERGSVDMSGTLKNNKVSFTVQGPRRSIKFTGTVDDNQMTGTTRRGITWTATRQ